MLHHLGGVRIPASADDILVTRRQDGLFVIAVWNLSAPEPGGESKDINLQFDSLTGSHRATMLRLDADHGSLTNAYVAMGSPLYPTQAQIQSLKTAAQLPAPESITICNGTLALHLAPKALVVIEIH